MGKNPVVYWEIASHNAEETVEFLKKAFNWDPEFDKDSGIYDFRQELRPKGFGGGVFTLKRAKIPFLTIYIEVENIEEKVKLIEENGGFIVEAPNEILPGIKICLFNEPSGVTLAMLQRLK